MSEDLKISLMNLDSFSETGDLIQWILDSWTKFQGLYPWKSAYLRDSWPVLLTWQTPQWSDLEVDILQAPSACTTFDWHLTRKPGVSRLLSRDLYSQEESRILYSRERTMICRQFIWICRYLEERYLPDRTNSTPCKHAGPASRF